MKKVKELRFSYNGLQLLFNRKIKAVAQCGHCEKDFMTTIQRTDYKYISCPYCGCVQETRLILVHNED